MSAPSSDRNPYAHWCCLFGLFTVPGLVFSPWAGLCLSLVAILLACMGLILALARRGTGAARVVLGGLWAWFCLYFSVRWLLLMP